MYSDLITYDPETGLFTWRTRSGHDAVRFNSRYAGKQAGTINNKGYRMIKINRKTVLAHRLAWFLTNGKWPTKHIDHINGVKTDNRIDNLRECTHPENMQNRSGVKGYHFHNQTGKFQAHITVNHKFISLGLFRTEEDASAAYAEAKKKYHTFNPDRR